MKEGQTSIFYMAADSKAAAESAPFVEQLVRRDYEVSLCFLLSRPFPSESSACPRHRQNGARACRKSNTSRGLEVHTKFGVEVGFRVMAKVQQ